MNVFLSAVQIVVPIICWCTCTAVPSHMVYQSALHYTTWDDGLDLATSMRAFPSQFPWLICYWGWAGSAARSRAQTRGAAVLVQLWLKWGGHDAVVHKVCRFWWPAGSDGTDHGVHARGRPCVVDRSGTVTSPTDHGITHGASAFVSLFFSLDLIVFFFIKIRWPKSPTARYHSHVGVTCVSSDLCGSDPLS